MTQTRSGRPHVPMSIAEAEVLRALEQLPPTFQVELNSPAIEVKGSEDIPAFNYQPDFVISPPSGKKLVVEVKSSNSLSLANLVRLVAIDGRVREQGNRFLLLAWGTDTPRSAARHLPEFEPLDISFVNSPGEAFHVIQTALTTSPSTGRPASTGVT